MPDSNDDPPRDRPWYQDHPDNPNNPNDRGGEDRPRRRDDDDARPRRRRRDDDDDYDHDRPRRRRRDEPAKSSAAIVIIAVVAGCLVLCCPLAFFLLLPAVERVRGAAARTQDSNNLKQIAIGLHGYSMATNNLPPAQEPVSWRVYMLPYIEQENLYRQFDLKEPWDGPTNRRLSSQRIPQFAPAGDTQASETHYRVFVGPNTLYPESRSPYKLTSVKDGTGNTFYAVESTDSVPWSQPKELQYDRNGALPQLGLPNRKGFLVTMMDGSVRFVSNKASADVIRAGIEPADGRFFQDE